MSAREPDWQLWAGKLAGALEVLLASERTLDVEVNSRYARLVLDEFEREKTAPRFTPAQREAHVAMARAHHDTWRIR